MKMLEANRASWTLAILFIVASCHGLSSFAAGQSSDEDHWYQINLAGSHVGWQHSSESLEGDERVSTTDMAMSLRRGEMVIDVSVESEWKELLSGTPVSVKMVQDMSAMKTITRWSFLPDMIKSLETSGGPPVTRELPLPEKAWLTPYQGQQYFLRKLSEGEKEISFETMSPEIGPRVITITFTHVGDDVMDVMDQSMDVSIWNMVNDAMPQMVTKQWIDGEGLMVASEIDIGIGKMMMTLVDKATALKETDSAPEVFNSLLIEPDRSIRNPWKARRVIMKVRTKNGSPVELPSVGCQTIAGTGDGSATVMVDVQMPQPVLPDERANPEFLGQSAMINPEDEVIIKLHEQSTASLPEEATTLDRADAMREFVFDFIEEKNLSTAFASASEVARTRMGDCSEHGVLLAALLRADGIPSRVVHGLVYVPGFGKKKQGAFGWHMWTQAQIDGNWVDVDATLPVRFSGGHITTGTSSLSRGAGSADMANMIPSINNFEIDVLRVDSE